MFSLLKYMKKMPAFSLPWRRRLENPNQMESAATPFYAMWDAVARLAHEIRGSDFMAEMIRINALASACGGDGVGRVHWHVVGIHLESFRR